MVGRSVVIVMMMVMVVEGQMITPRFLYLDGLEVFRLGGSDGALQRRAHGSGSGCGRGSWFRVLVLLVIFDLLVFLVAAETITRCGQAGGREFVAWSRGVHGDEVLLGGRGLGVEVGVHTDGCWVLFCDPG